MAYSSVLIEFLEVPNVDEQINILEDFLGINIIETFKAARAAAEQSELPFYESTSGRYYNFVSSLLVDAINLDANLTGQFTLDWSYGPDYSGIGNVLITANFSGAMFAIVTNTTSADITITNEIVIPPPENTVSPNVIDFNVVLGISGAAAKQLTIDTLLPWTITGTLPAWLSLSSLSGTGDAVVDVSPVNYLELAVGEYSTTFSVNIDGEAFVIIVNLKVIDFLKCPFEAGKLYFTQELDYLKFSSDTPETYIDFAIQIKTFKINTYEEIIYNRTYKFPLFQGKGDFHIGTIVHDLFEEIKELSDFVPDLKTNFSKTQSTGQEIATSQKN